MTSFHLVIYIYISVCCFSFLSCIWDIYIVQVFGLIIFFIGLACYMVVIIRENGGWSYNTNSSWIYSSILCNPGNVTCMSLCRLLRSSTSPKMICYLKTWWYLTHMVRSLFGLASAWNQRRNKRHLILVRYNLMPWSYCFWFAVELPYWKLWWLLSCPEIHRACKFYWRSVSICTTI
jgi:hypothetical protein